MDPELKRLSRGLTQIQSRKRNLQTILGEIEECEEIWMLYMDVYILASLLHNY